MQIIYAAPFILFSILSFAVCLTVPRLRRFALPALAVPVTFGMCSIAGWILSILIAEFVLKLNLGPAIGFHGVVEGLFFYIFPGILGAWLVVKLIRVFERYFLKTLFARNLILRTVIALIAAFIGGITGLGFATNLLQLGSTVASIWIALLASVVAAVIGFTITLLIQRHFAGKYMA